MEESEKRRERLKAMRMEAAQITNSESPGLPPGALSNPLIETDTASASPHQYNTLPRFDYYTDPMAAFSGSKKMNNISPRVSQGHYNTPPRPMDNGMITNPAYHYQAMNSPSPGPGIFNVPRPHFNQGPVRSPMGAANPLYRPQQNPSSWVGSGGTFNSPNFSRGCNFPNPSFGQGSSPYVDYGRGRGPQGQNMNSHYNSGRGRGRGRSYGNSMSPVGSGPNFRGGASSYYRKEMVEDPWLGLTPVMWKDVGVIDSKKSWLPKSIAMKKMKASPEAPHASISQPSLAEYLAASFDDSVVEDEKGNFQGADGLQPLHGEEHFGDPFTLCNSTSWLIDANCDIFCNRRFDN